LKLEKFALWNLRLDDIFINHSFTNLGYLDVKDKIENLNFYKYFNIFIKYIKMIFEIKTLTGRKFNLSTDDYKTFDDVKIAIQEREGVDKSQIRLINGGKLINNENVCDIINKQNIVIYMILALRGG